MTGYAPGLSDEDWDRWEQVKADARAIGDRDRRTAELLRIGMLADTTGTAAAFRRLEVRVAEVERAAAAFRWAIHDGRVWRTRYHHRQIARRRRKRR